jgi:transcriptional regulator with XRE-family HTH domain
MELSAGTLGALERGAIKSPTLATLLRLMPVLGVPSIELLLGPGLFPSAHLSELPGLAAPALPRDSASDELA